MLKKLFLFFKFFCGIALLAFLTLAIYIAVCIPKSEIPVAERYSSDKLNINNVESILQGIKALTFHDDFLYCQKDNFIVRTKDFGKTFEHVADIDYSNLSTFYKAFMGSDIFRRIARIEVHRLKIAPNGNIAFTTKGGVYLIPAGEKKGALISKTPESRPISLTVDKDNHFYYGEYISNPERRGVNVFKSSPDGKLWEKVYTYPEKTIRHIHAVEFDPYENCVWIATGDDNSETFLTRASLDFKDVKTVLHGDQKNRYFEIRVLPDKLFLTPDAPNGDDYVTIYDKKSGKENRILKVEGVTFFSTILGNYFICATSNEPYAKGSCEYLNTHVWAINIDTLQARKIAIFGTDFLYRFSLMNEICPIPGLFQFSNAFFPEGKSPDTTKLIIFGNGLEDINRNSAIWNVSELLSF